MGSSNSTQEKTAEEKSLAEAKKYVDDHCVADVGSFSKKQIEDWKKVKLNLAITGDSGSGKSTFINAIRGLNDYDKGAAKVNVKEETRVPTNYTYPDYPNIILCDLPGIGTVKHPDIEGYSKEISLEKFDAFLIFMKGRFTNFDLELAMKAAETIKKPFFFIRAHIQTELSNAQNSEGPTYNEGQVLKRMREDCYENLGEFLRSKEDVFLIDNYVKDKWDFDKLIEAITKQLPDDRKKSFILSLSCLTRECLQRKANILRGRALLVVFTTTVVESFVASEDGFMPRGVIELKVILDEIKEYHKQFGVPKYDSEIEAEYLDGESRETLLKYYFPTVMALFNGLSAELVNHCKEKVSECILEGQKEFISSASTCSRMSVYLVRCINELEKTALRIWDKHAEDLRKI